MKGHLEMPGDIFGHYSGVGVGSGNALGIHLVESRKAAK